MTPTSGWVARSAIHRRLILCRPVESVMGRDHRSWPLVARGAQCEPWRELFPAPAVHLDLAALAAFAMSDEDRASSSVQVTLGQRESLTNPQAGPHRITISLEA